MKSTDRIVDGMNIGVVIALVIWFSVSGCASPLVSANLSNEINISDSANGNTVPLVGP